MTRPFAPRKMTGRCASGAERDHGVRAHAVPTTADGKFYGWGAALCGAKPGLRGNGWSDYVDEAVTCPGCLRTISRRGAAGALEG